MSLRHSIERARGSLIPLLFIHFTLLGFWLVKRGQYFLDNPSAQQVFTTGEYLKVFLTWLAFGAQGFACHHNHRVGMFINAVFASLFLGLYLTYFVVGTTFGVGETCHAHMGSCFLEHFVTSIAMVITGIMVLDVVVSLIWLDRWGWPKPRPVRPAPRIVLAPARPIPPPAPQPTPVPATPAIQPKPEQPKKVPEQDRQSVISSSTTLQGEEVQTDKDKKKRHSTITIYSIDEHELGPIPEQTIVPNPVSGNPGSTPNKGL
ncbi:hypothetical protein EC991_010209 [Linnemannia zychae]|nr:hypothetical protein EC991_010209 [Linnemannia zychae]